MRGRREVRILLVLALFASAVAASDWRASEVVTSYVSGTSPTLILGFDNNLEICLALRRPMTLEELEESGVPVTRSQVTLLRLWNLVARDEEGRLECTVPIIEPPISEEMDALAVTVAEHLLEAAHAETEAFLQTVDASGWSESRYALLGSFVLDGLVWEALERIGAIESADPSTIPSGSDQWSGVSWITLPPRSAKLGTDSHTSDRGTLFAAWSPAALEAQAELRRSGLREALIVAASGVPPSEGRETSELRELGLIRDGSVRVPVIDGNGPLCRAGGELALPIAEALAEDEQVGEMLGRTGARDRSVAMIVAYHWIYPALLDLLQTSVPDSMRLEPPALLAGRADAELAPTLYIVARGTKCVPPAVRSSVGAGGS